MRQDAWTNEDDAILAETTLRHIREGSTQLAAFEEVAKALNRTPAACGYRWNANVRRQYMDNIGMAKQKRKERKEEIIVSGLTVDDHSERMQLTLSWTEVLRFLRNQRRDFQTLQNRIRQLEKDVEFANFQTDRLNQEKQGLETQINKLSEEYKLINDDYRALLGIVDRARERVFGMPHDA